MTFDDLDPGDYFKYYDSSEHIFRKLKCGYKYRTTDFLPIENYSGRKVILCDEFGKEIVETVSFNQIKEGQFFISDGRDEGMVFQKPYKPYRDNDMIIIKYPRENVLSTGACADMSRKCWIIVASPDT